MSLKLEQLALFQMKKNVTKEYWEVICISKNK